MLSVMRTTGRMNDATAINGQPVQVLDRFVSGYAGENARTFQLSSSPMRPLVCEVSLSEMLAFSLNRSWGGAKAATLTELEPHVVVHISEPGAPPLSTTPVQRRNANAKCVTQGARTPSSRG